MATKRRGTARGGAVYALDRVRTRLDGRLVAALPPEELGRMLSRLREVGSLEALEEDIVTTERFPQFKELWWKGYPGYNLGQTLCDAMMQAIEEIEL
ncbi:hypothetical protein ABW21_db0202653 [Orbilia brochopaga]|nr:hypothetical protein ABW21_db0202653 [Drechslerella brochopaga]